MSIRGVNFQNDWGTIQLEGKECQDTDWVYKYADSLAICKSPSGVGYRDTTTISASNPMFIKRTFAASFTYDGGVRFRKRKTGLACVP